MAIFTDSFTRMRQDFDQSHADREQLIQDTRDKVREHASNTREMMQGMHDKTAEMADKLRTTLQDLKTDLKTGGDIFRKESRRGTVAREAAPTNGHSRTKPKNRQSAKAKRGG